MVTQLAAMLQMSTQWKGASTFTRLIQQISSEKKHLQHACSFHYKAVKTVYFYNYAVEIHLKISAQDNLNNQAINQTVVI